MYSFMRSRSELSDRVEGDQTFLTEMVQDSDDEEDQLDKAVKKSQVCLSLVKWVFENRIGSLSHRNPLRCVLKYFISNTLL